jgi:CheY-like chemotaxis protein
VVKKDNISVMIVDDSLIDQKITVHLLKNNYDVNDIVLMDNGTSALLYLNNYPYSELAKPLLVLLDMDMPEMNGLEFLKAYDLLDSSLKSFCTIVVLTASEVEKDLESLKNNKYVMKVVQKPLQKNSIEEFLF